MLKIVQRLVLALALVGALPWSAAAQEEKSWGLEVGYDRSSRYVFRGVDLLDGEPLAVPYLTFTSGNFGIYLSGYIGEFSDAAGGGDYQEIDYAADYTWDVGDNGAGFTLGLLHYTYQEPDFDPTSEVYAIYSFGGVLSPTLSAYYDFEEVEGGYVSFGVSHDFELTDRFTVGVASSVGYDWEYNSTLLGTADTKGLNDVLIEASFNWQLGSRFGIHGKVQRSIALDILDDAGQEDETITTLGAGLTF